MKAKIRLRGLLCLLKKRLNKPKILIPAILFIYICALCIAVKAQQPPPERRTLSGIVVSANDNKPILGVTVKESINHTKETLTDKNGSFTVSVRGQYGGNLFVSMEGYDNQMIPFSISSTNLKINLQPINDPFLGQNPDFKALEIGEKVPDIEFALKNYHSPTAKISDFKGKLLIFDFWTTYCAPCITSFPKMEKLQKQFGDKIQIILVNVRENEEQIAARLKKISIIPHQQLYTMPSIVSNKALDQLFPHQYAGNYVWIDKEGIFRVSSGLSYNNHAVKINDVLEGKEITFLKEGKPYNKGENILSQLIIDSPKKHPELGSIFTSVLKDYVPFGGTIVGEIDSVSKTIRNTHVNRSVLELFYYALDEKIKQEWKLRVYGPNFGTKSYLDHFLLLVKDSSLYDNRLIIRAKETDNNMIQSQFCYEQILPLNATKEQQMQFMRSDLTRFFGLKYGLTTSIEEVPIPGYILKVLNDNPVNENDIRKVLKHLGKREYIKTISVEGIIGSYYRPTGQEELGSWIPYVFDVDGVNKKREIIMPVWKTGDKLEDFIQALKANGLEYFKGEKKMKMIVIRDNQ